MYTCVDGDEINIFNQTARVLAGGFSSSGKSFWVSKIIRKYRQLFNNVIIIGSDFEGVDDLEVIRNDNFNPAVDNLPGRTLVIFDDVIYNKKKLKIAGDSFVRSRHNKTDLIFLTQNIYLSDPDFRIISLNTTHVTLFRNRDIKQINYFARTFLDNDEVKIFVDLYKKLVLNIKYGYILIDFTKNSGDPLNIRSNVVGEGYERAYKLMN